MTRWLLIGLLGLLCSTVWADEEGGWLGIRTSTAPGQELVVKVVHAGGPAAKAGVQVDDRLLALDGVELEDWDHFDRLMNATKPRQSLRVTIRRDGAQLTLRARLIAFPANPYLPLVDEALDDAGLRAAIRAVQPGCVRVGRASGVNISPDGLVLTCAHLLLPSRVLKLGGEEARAAAELALSLSAIPVVFPDGEKWAGMFVAFDPERDLLLFRLASYKKGYLRALLGADNGSDGRRLPHVPLAAAPPVKGDTVVCIGSPQSDPEGPAYSPFHVSRGAVRGWRDGAREGEQSLGRLKHDAWTYWGHSGAPLLSAEGRLVGLHNSWDPATRMRHAVPLEAIRAFLREHDVPLEGE